jgi:hypothetical protein
MNSIFKLSRFISYFCDAIGAKSIAGFYTFLQKTFSHIKQLELIGFETSNQNLANQPIGIKPMGLGSGPGVDNLSPVKAGLEGFNIFGTRPAVLQGGNSFGARPANNTPAGQNQQAGFIGSNLFGGNRTLNN